MAVTEGDIPQASLLSKDVIATAYYHDSYSASLSVGGLSVIDIFFGVFGHRPPWMKALFIARNGIVSVFGLQAPSAADVIKTEIKSHYRVGDIIGTWPIYTLTDSELIAGRDNTHLDFRLSILKVDDSGSPRVFISTVCTVNNIFGPIYLFFILPFHKQGVKRLIRNAIETARI